MAARQRLPIQHRRAFTLMELVVSLAISSVVLLGVVSLLSLSARAVPPPGGVQEVSVEAADLLARLGTDLSTATQITEATATALTLVVPDRNADMTDETIRYSWSGVASEPVLRTINAGTPAEMLSDTTGFALAYGTQPASAWTTQTRATGGVASIQSTLGGAKFTKKPGNDWFAQVIDPTLPPNAIAWTLDEVVLCFVAAGAQTTVFTCEIRGCDASLNPTAVVYASFTVTESDLGTAPAAWRQSLPGITVPAGTRLSIVVRATASDGSCDMCLASPAVWSATAPHLISKDSGLTWAPGSKPALEHEASGRVITSDGGPESRTALGVVTVNLAAGEQAWSTSIALTGLNPTVRGGAVAALPAKVTPVVKVLP